MSLGSNPSAASKSSPAGQAPATLGSPSTMTTPRAAQSASHLEMTVASVHNWVELVYEAFGHKMPTGPGEVALLGLRGAKLAAVSSGNTAPAQDTLERGVGETSDAFDDAATDLLFLAYAPKEAGDAQVVEVFECSIGISPLNRACVPDLIEGQLFHVSPDSYFGDYLVPNVKDILAINNGQDKATALVDVARTELQNWEAGGVNPASRYGSSENWCGRFVSFCMKRAGMGTIAYSDCFVGPYRFLTGDWGQWLPGTATAKPGDVYFMNLDPPSTYDARWPYSHTGIVVSDADASIETIDGNTGPGIVREQDRPKSTAVTAICRPRSNAIIRWKSPSETPSSSNSPSGETVVHHPYFREDVKIAAVETGGFFFFMKKDPQNRGGGVAGDGNIPWPKDPLSTAHPDKSLDAHKTPKSRYYEFLSRVTSAANKAKEAPSAAGALPPDGVPYLIVSSKYVRTHHDWVLHVKNQNHNSFPVKPPPSSSSVLKREGLKSPKAPPSSGGYLPSFLTAAGYDDAQRSIREDTDSTQAEREADLMFLDRALLRPIAHGE